MEQFLSEKELGELQDCLVDMLVDFDEFCRAQGLCYLLCYGTALGAYRHSGFIPWDDDLDIMMPRNDFEKLIESYRNNRKYVLQNVYSEQSYYHTFCKLRRKDTLYIERESLNVYEQNGVFIDIFPLDNVDDPKKIISKLKYAYVKLMNQSLAFRACEENIKNTMGSFQYYIRKILFGLCLCGRTNKRIIQRMNKVMMSSKGEDFVTIFDNAYGYRREMLSREIVLPPKEVLFCGKKFFAPNKIEDYLSQIYGDKYMLLPPVDKRKSHKPIVFKL